LVRRDPVVIGDRVVIEVRLQLLQRRIVVGGRVGRGKVVPAVGIREERRRIVLHGVVVLLAAVVGVGDGGVSARAVDDRRNPLALRENIAGAVGIDVFLVRLPGESGVVEIGR